MFGNTLLAGSMLDESEPISTFACGVVTSKGHITFLITNNNAITTLRHTVLLLLSEPTRHAAASLASHATNLTFLFVAKVSMETDIINTNMVSTTSGIGVLTERKVLRVNTVDSVVVAEGAIIRIDTRDTGITIEDVTVNAGSAGIIGTLETAIQTEFLRADVFRAG